MPFFIVETVDNRDKATITIEAKPRWSALGPCTAGYIGRDIHGMRTYAYGEWGDLEEAKAFCRRAFICEGGGLNVVHLIE